jgi:CBS domain-containing protein
MRVQDLMTRQVATVRESDPASEALRLMWECDCGSVPVIGEDGRARAIVTDRDIAMTLRFRDSAPSVVSVSDAMSRLLHSCAPNDSIAAAEEIMRKHQIRRLPVLDGDGRLLGVISMADIVRTAADQERQEVVPTEFTAIFAEICAPRTSREQPGRR